MPAPACLWEALSAECAGQALLCRLRKQWSAAAGLDCHAQASVCHSLRYFLQALAPRLNNLHFSLAQMLSGRPLCVLCVLRHTQHFSELEPITFEVHILQNCYPSDDDHFHTGLCSTTFRCEI